MLLRLTLFLLPIATAAMLLGSLLPGGDFARAATPVYADPAGTCAGLTPCFTTVQEAVDNAGPPPAVVNIFPGTYAEQVNLSDMGIAIEEPPGDITLQALNASGAPAVGTVTISPATGPAVYEESFPFPGSITINGIVATSDSDTFNLWAEGDLTLSGTATDNGGSDGADLESNGDITVADSTANNNENGGFNISSVGNVTITDSTANGNLDAEGFDIESDGDVTITGVEASGNFDEGFEIDGFEGSAAGTVTISDTVANDSESDDGIDATAQAATITDVTANNNADEGVQTFVTGDTVVDRVTALGNENDGVDVEGGSGEGTMAGNITVRNSNLQANTSGIEILEGQTFVTGALLANSNVMCDNTIAGLTSLDDHAINGEGNWWGAASGPTHPSNASGTGDDVLDGANPGSLSALGTVDFDPFVSASSGSGSAVVGQASTISFQFTGGSGAVRLQEGPGDETGASPWSVTTNNGTATVGFLSGGILEVSLTAAAAGTANVTVTGPCGLTASLAVAVTGTQASPSPSPTATPAQLPRTGGRESSGGTPAVLLAIAMLGLTAILGGWLVARRFR